MKKKLTDNQRRFCEEYSIDRHGTRAYMVAYPYVKKEQTAAAAATRLLRNVNISEYIQQLLDEAAERTAITTDRVLREWGKMAFFDIRGFYNEDGSLRAIADLDDDAAAAIAGMEVKVLADKTGNEYAKLHKIKLVDRKGNLDSIAKHLGMFIERREISGPEGGPIQTREEIVQELFESIDGATRGLPKPRIKTDE